jgi:dTDP-4-dehydrorhamnose reductase
MYLILGSTGMLGTEICKLLQARHEKYETLGVRPPWHTYAQTSLADTIINCAGALTDAPVWDQVYVNAEVPVNLRKTFSGRIVYVSTDCVFSGRLETYPEFNRYHFSNVPDPSSTYGITKRLGETQADLVIRTSFIGHKHGLLRWAIDHKGQRVDGWTKAYWTGSTVDIVAANILAMADNPLFAGIHHLSTPRVVNKYQVLEAISKVYELDLDILSSAEPYINRALEPTQSITWDIESALEHYLENNPIMTGVK